MPFPYAFEFTFDTLSETKYQVEVDWDNDGVFEGGDERITDDVQSIQFSRGKSDELGKAEVGQCTIRLNNSDGTYTPTLSSSALYGNLEPKRALKVYYSGSSTNYPEFYGYIEEIIPHPHLSEQYCIITAVDGLDYLARQDLNTALIKSHKTGEVINGILYEGSFPKPTSSTGLVFELPLFHPALDGTEIISRDDYRHTCSVIGATWTSSGCSFDGSDDYIDAGNGSGLSTLSAMTAVGWFKPEAISTDWAGMVDKQTTASEKVFWFGQKDTDGFLRFGIYLDGNTETSLDTTAAQIADDTWSHIAVTYDGHYQKIYVAGDLKETSADRNSALYQGTSSLYIGKGAVAWNGSIGELRIYNTAMASADILKDYNITKWRYPNVIDGGRNTIPYWHGHDIKARSAIEEIEDSEFGFFYINSSGDSVFEDRHHRWSSTHQTSQYTFADTMAGITYNMNPRTVYNTVKATVTPWELQTSAELWRLEEVPSMFASESKTFWGNASISGEQVFVDAWADPTISVDYTANTASDGSGTDTSSHLTVSTTKFAQSIKYDVNNNYNGNVYVTLLRGSGTYYDDKTTVTIKASETASSEAKFQKRTLNLQGKYMSDTDVADGVTKIALERYKDPQGEITIVVEDSTSTLRTQLLTREISDRITALNTKLGINSDYFIDHMQHEIIPGGQKRHTATYKLKDTSNEDFWVLDFSALGTQSKLGY